MPLRRVGSLQCLVRPLRTPVVKMESRAGVDNELDEVIWISARDLMRARRNLSGYVEGVRPGSPINENGTACATVVMIYNEIGLSVRRAH